MTVETVALPALLCGGKSPVSQQGTPQLQECLVCQAALLCVPGVGGACKGRVSALIQWQQLRASARASKDEEIPRDRLRGPPQRRPIPSGSRRAKCQGRRQLTSMGRGCRRGEGGLGSAAETATFPPGPGRWAPTCSLTSGGLQPLVFDAVSDLGFWVALRKVTGDDRRVPLIHFNHVLHV